MGPNLRRSHTTEWKKQSAKMIDLSSPCLEQPSHTASVNELYARSMLALRPLGGSFVNLIEFCKMGTGTTFCGRLERKTRKLGCAPSLSASSFFSSLGSQVATSSMFSSIAQPPLVYIWSSAFSATGSCPCPSETVISLPPSSSITGSIALPSARTSAVASTPGESRKKMGTAGPESSNETGRSKLIASPYRDPSTDMTHERSDSVMRSGRMARMMSSCWKPPSRFQSVGSCSVSGVGCSDHSFQRFHEPSRSAGSDTNSSWLAARPQTRPHVSSPTHEATGFSRALSTGGTTSRSSSLFIRTIASASDSDLVMLIASCVEKVRRWRSKRPLETNLKSVYVIDSSSSVTRSATPAAPSASGCAALSSALR
mmetsp:Transcript_9629/g.23316  ORF Transcript_9629/g.23316 Transcript_9629/m.23316 type:complete len:370 (+) Transcript_9629:1472-2581(+)